MNVMWSVVSECDVVCCERGLVCCESVWAVVNAVVCCECVWPVVNECGLL